MSKEVALSIFDSKGAAKGKLDLDALFSKSVRQAVVYDTVRYQLLKRRAGTHSVLTKGVMKGGNKKPWKQKGTGRARAGSNTSPVWVGGAVAHGPKPRSYENRITKRTRTKSLVGVLKDKIVAEQLYCFEEFKAEKTADFSKLLKKLKLEGKKVLFVAGQDLCSDTKDCCETPKIFKAIRNVKGVRIICSSALNTYDVINSDAVVCTKATFEQVSQGLKNRAKLN